MAVGKKVVAAILVIGLAVAGGWWWQNRSQKSSAQQQTRFVEEQVRRGSIRSTIQGTGPVASVNGVIVRANQSGTVTNILAQDGDTVKAGQPIVELENDNLEANLKQAQIDLQNNRASLDNLLNPASIAVRAQELKLESARLTLSQRQADVANLRVTAPVAGVVSAVNAVLGSSINANTLLFSIYDDATPTFRVSLPQSTAALIKMGSTVKIDIPGMGLHRATVEQNGSAATPTSGNKDANVPLELALPALPGIRAGMVGQATFEVTGLSYLVIANGTVENDGVEVRALVSGTVSAVSVRAGDRIVPGDLLALLTNDALQIQLKQAENDIATQQQNLENLLTPEGDPNSQVRTLRSKIEQGLITLESRTADVQDLKVKAPVAGQISSLTLRIGDRITTNQQLFRVADYNVMQITITVDELDIARTRVGQQAAITLDALPGRPYQGKVIKINPEGVFRNDIATFEVTVQVENPRGLMAGMNSTVNIVVEERNNVLFVPAQAVQVQRGRAAVQVREGEQAVQKEVQIGLRTAQQVEIVSGLSEGDKVITAIIRPAAAAGGLGLFGGGNRQQNQTTFPAPAGGTPAGGQPGGGLPGGGQRPGGFGGGGQGGGGGR